MTSSSYVNRAAGGGQQEPTISSDGPEPPCYARYFVVPIEVYELLRQKKITANHFVLLGQIDMMVNWRGMGCWASNNRLAELIGVQNRWVRKLIQDCKELGLIVDKGIQEVVVNGKVFHRRVLETSWSRVREGGLGRTRGGGPAKTTNTNKVLNNKPSRAPAGGGAALAGDEGVAEETPVDRPAGFFPEFDHRHRKKDAVTDFDIKCAKLLRSALVGRNLAGKWSLSAWANHFRLLREADCGGDRLEVWETLEWYCAVVGQEYMPQSFSAKSFREDFRRIQAAKQRAEKHLAVEREREGVSKESLEIVQKYLKKYHWPKGSERDLPLAVERSLQAHKRLRKAYEAFDPLADTRLRGFHAHVRHKLFGRSQDFVVRWFEGVFEAVSGWAEWSGNILSCAFEPGREQFQREGLAAAQAYSGKSQLWDDYWTELKELL